MWPFSRTYTYIYRTSVVEILQPVHLYPTYSAQTEFCNVQARIVIRGWTRILGAGVEGFPRVRSAVCDAEKPCFWIDECSSLGVTYYILLILDVACTGDCTRLEAHDRG